MSDDLQIIRPQGRLDSTSSPAVESQALGVIDGGARRLLIDFVELDYMSSAGLRMTLTVAKRMKAAGGRLAFCSLKPQIAEIFQISGVDAILDIHPSAEAATARLLDG